MTVVEFLARRGRVSPASPDLPRKVIPFPFARVPERATPTGPLTELGNDDLRGLFREVLAEMMRRARALTNRWAGGPRFTLSEMVSRLGGETYDARIEFASKSGGLDMLPIAREAAEGAP